MGCTADQLLQGKHIRELKDTAMEIEEKEQKKLSRAAMSCEATLCSLSTWNFSPGSGLERPKYLSLKIFKEIMVKFFQI